MREVSVGSVVRSCIPNKLLCEFRGASILKPVRQPNQVDRKAHRQGSLRRRARSDLPRPSQQLTRQKQGLRWLARASVEHNKQLSTVCREEGVVLFKIAGFGAGGAVGEACSKPGL